MIPKPFVLEDDEIPVLVRDRLCLLGGAPDSTQVAHGHAEIRIREDHGGFST
jgi:hypothetical protein